MRASGTSVSTTRSMYSTWKMALDRAWAGSVMDLLGQAQPFGFLGLHDPGLDVGALGRDGQVGVSSLGPGTCGIHRRPSIRVVIHGQTISNTRTSSRGSSAPAGPRPQVELLEAFGAGRRRIEDGRPVAVVVAEDDQQVRAREGRLAGEVEHVRRGLVRQGERRDPVRLGHPDREVRDDRPGRRVERVADGRHPAAEFLEHGRRALRAAGERRQQGRREEQRTEDRRAAVRARRPGASNRGARPAGRSRRPVRAGRTGRSGPGPARRHGGTSPRSWRPGRAGWSRGR